MFLGEVKHRRLGKRDVVTCQALAVVDDDESAGGGTRSGCPWSWHCARARSYLPPVLPLQSMVWPVRRNVPPHGACSGE